MNITERDCEIVKNLIEVCYDTDPGAVDMLLGECFDLYGRMVLAAHGTHESDMNLCLEDLMQQHYSEYGGVKENV